MVVVVVMMMVMTMTLVAVAIAMMTVRFRGLLFGWSARCWFGLRPGSDRGSPESDTQKYGRKKLLDHLRLLEHASPLQAAQEVCFSRHEPLMNLANSETVGPRSRRTQCVL
jgi:hypothetical protein